MLSELKYIIFGAPIAIGLALFIYILTFIPIEYIGWTVVIMWLLLFTYGIGRIFFGPEDNSDNHGD